MRISDWSSDVCSSDRTTNRSKTVCSNIRTIPGPSHGKGARSPKCCDRGIMRRSRPGGNNRHKIIHGYAGRTFGSAMRVLGTDLPLARGEKKRPRGHEPHPDARMRRHHQGDRTTDEQGKKVREWGEH